MELCEAAWAAARIFTLRERRYFKVQLMRTCDPACAMAVFRRLPHVHAPLHAEFTVVLQRADSTAKLLTQTRIWTQRAPVADCVHATQGFRPDGRRVHVVRVQHTLYEITRSRVRVLAKSTQFARGTTAYARAGLIGVDALRHPDGTYTIFDDATGDATFDPHAHCRVCVNGIWYTHVPASARTRIRAQRIRAAFGDADVSVPGTVTLHVLNLPFLWDGLGILNVKPCVNLDAALTALRGGTDALVAMPSNHAVAATALRDAAASGANVHIHSPDPYAVTFMMIQAAARRCSRKNMQQFKTALFSVLRFWTRAWRRMRRFPLPAHTARFVHVRYAHATGMALRYRTLGRCAVRTYRDFIRRESDIPEHFELPVLHAFAVAAAVPNSAFQKIQRTVQ